MYIFDTDISDRRQDTGNNNPISVIFVSFLVGDHATIATC